MPKVPTISNQRGLPQASGGVLLRHPGAPGVRLNPEQEARAATGAQRASAAMQGILSSAGQAMRQQAAASMQEGQAFAEIGRIGERITKFGEHMAYAEDVREVNKAVVQGEEAIAKLRLEYKQRTDDPKTWLDEYQKQATEIRKSLMKDMSPRAQAAFDRAFSRAQLAGFRDIGEHARLTLVRQGQAEIASGMDRLTNLAIEARDWSISDQQRLLAELQSTAKRAVDAGYYTPVKARKMVQERMVKVARAHIDSAVFETPEVVLGAIKDPKSNPGMAELLDLLPPSQKREVRRSARQEIRMREAEKRRQEAEQKRLAAQEAAQARDESRNVLAEIEATGEIPASRVDSIAKALNAHKPGDGSKFRREAEFIAQATAAVKTAQGLPINQRADYIAKAIMPAKGDKDFALKWRTYQRALTRILRLNKAELEDPAAFAAKDALAEIDRGVKSGTMPPKPTPAHEDEAILRAQEARGIPPHRQRLIPKAQAKDLKAQFIKAPLDEKLSMLEQLQAAHGKFFGRVLEEMDLPKQVGFAASLPGMEAKRFFLQIATMKDSDIPLVDVAPVDIATKTQSKFEDSPFGEYLNARAALSAGQDNEPVSWRNNVFSLAKRAVRYYVSNGTSVDDAAKKVMQMLNAGANTYVDEDLAVIMVPDGADVDRLTAGMRFARKDLPADFVVRDWSDQRAGLLKLEDAREGGVWVNYGNAFVLMDPTDGHMYTNAEGKPYVKTADELQELGLLKTPDYASDYAED